MKLLFVLLSALASLVCVADSSAEAPQGDTFLSPSNREALSKATSACARGIMHDYPRPMYPMAHDFKPLCDEEDARFLERSMLAELKVHILRAAPIDIAERLKTCTFQPGINFTFYADSRGLPPSWPKPILSVLYCLNCDLWAVTRNTSSYAGVTTTHADIATYGDARASRDVLLQMRAKISKVPIDLPRGSATK